MEPIYTAISQGLNVLRNAKKPLKVFGAQEHRFGTNPPLSEREVGEFEAPHQVVLPADYRGFLIHVGNGGAGPAYGVLKLGHIDMGYDQEPWKVEDGLVGTLLRPFPHTKAWNEREPEPEWDEQEPYVEWEAKYEKRLEALDARYWSNQQVDGAIPICHLGCALRQWLVVTGAEAGNVWNDFRADYRGLQPLQQNGRERVRFLEWYVDWLNEALGQIGGERVEI